MVKIANFLQLKNVQVNKNGLKINGLYGLSIAYSDLVQVDTTSSILRINGYAPYARIILKGQLPIYINFTDKQKTLDLYNRLIIKKSLSPTLCLFNDGGCSVFRRFSSSFISV
jgi:hypothetical protein